MLNTFRPGRGSNQDLLLGSQTLYRVAIKAGLNRKAVPAYNLVKAVRCRPFDILGVGGGGGVLGYFSKKKSCLWFFKKKKKNLALKRVKKITCL